MKFLRKILMSLLAVTFFVGCSDDDDSTVELSTISLSTDVLQVQKEGGELPVTVTSSGEWRLSGVCDWVKPSVTSGKSGDVVTFTIDENKKKDVRSFTFKFFTGSAVVPLKVESHPGESYLELLSSETMSVEKEKGLMSIQLSTNIQHPVISYSDNGETWLKFNKRSEFIGKVNLFFDVDENATYKDRSSIVTIANPSGNEIVEVKVTQSKTETVIVEKTSLIYDMAARSISFTMKSNIDYQVNVESGKEWITNQTISEPQVGEDGLNTVTVSYKLAEANGPRAGVIRVVKSSNKDIVKELSIIQKDPTAPLIEIPDESLAEICKSSGWILPVEGKKCLVLDAGLKATHFTNSSWSTQLSDLTGIEHFPNLTHLDLGYCNRMTKLDISGLHKVVSLKFKGVEYIESYNLGDNPVENFMIGGEWDYVYVRDIKIIGSKVESMDLHILDFISGSDMLSSLDVSECPALKTLNIERGENLTKLYLKRGQEIPNLIKRPCTVIEYK